MASNGIDDDEEAPPQVPTGREEDKDGNDIVSDTSDVIEATAVASSLESPPANTQNNNGKEENAIPDNDSETEAEAEAETAATVEPKLPGSPSAESPKSDEDRPTTPPDDDSSLIVPSAIEPSNSIAPPDAARLSAPRPSVPAIHRDTPREKSSGSHGSNRQEYLAKSGRIAPRASLQPLVPPKSPIRSNEQRQRSEARKRSGGRDGSDIDVSRDSSIGQSSVPGAVRVLPSTASLDDSTDSLDAGSSSAAAESPPVPAPARVGSRPKPSFREDRAHGIRSVAAVAPNPGTESRTNASTLPRSTGPTTGSPASKSSEKEANTSPSRPAFVPNVPNTSVTSLTSRKPSITPVVAELVAAEEDIADKIKEQIQQEMEEKFQREIQERLNQERRLQVVAQAVEIDSPLSQSNLQYQHSSPSSRSHESEADDDGKMCGQPKWVCLGLFGSCVVLALVGIVLGITLGGPGVVLPTPAPIPSPPPTESPTPAPTRFVSPEFVELLERIGALVAEDLAVFDDPSTFQYQALDWMANRDGYLRGGSVTTTPNQMLVERYALVVLYLSTRGESWAEQFGFLGDTSVCEWQVGIEEGVFCAEEGLPLVTELFLLDAAIQGTLPSELGLLTSLQTLVMDENLVFGSMPTELFSVTMLGTISFESCALDGTIPTEISDLTNLVRLDLENNNLWGTLPTELGRLTSLQVLQVLLNRLTGTIPTEVGGLPALTSLDVEGNDLTGTIPTELGRPPFVSLFLENNRFRGTVPTELGRLLDARTLFLHRNELTGTLPTELGLLFNLENLLAYDNQLTGTIPSEYANLSELRSVSLEANGFVGGFEEAFCVPQTRRFVGLYADCGGDTPEVACSCCTDCCDDSMGCEENNTTAPFL